MLFYYLCCWLAASGAYGTGDQPVWMSVVKLPFVKLLLVLLFFSDSYEN